MCYLPTYHLFSFRLCPHLFHAADDLAGAIQGGSVTGDELGGRDPATVLTGEDRVTCGDPLDRSNELCVEEEVGRRGGKG